MTIGMLRGLSVEVLF